MPPLEVQREVKGQQLFGPAAKARSGWLTPMGPLHQFPWKIGHWAQMIWGHVANEMPKVHVETLATYSCGTQITPWIKAWKNTSHALPETNNPLRRTGHQTERCCQLLSHPYTGLALDLQYGLTLTISHHHASSLMLPTYGGLCSTLHQLD